MSFVDKLKHIFGGDGGNGRDSEFRSQHAAAGRSDYERHRPAYQYGYAAAYNPDYQGKSFEQVEASLRSDWQHEHSAEAGDWNSVCESVRDAFARGQARVLTEEAALHKQPLVREEIEVTKRAVSDTGRLEADLDRRHAAINDTTSRTRGGNSDEVTGR